MTDENRRVFVIADIHGDMHGFLSIINQMADDGMNLNRDLLIQLGDMIDGYPHSRDVVTALRTLQYLRPNNVVVLLGNHEDMLMRAVGKHDDQSDFRNWWYQGGAETHRSYHQWFSDESLPFLKTYMHSDGTFHLQPFVPNAALASAISWFETLPLYYETEDFIFVHAGLREPFPLEAQKRHDLLWIREPFHNSTYDWGKPVVYGHTAREAPLIEKNKIGLDCRWRGRGYVSGAELTRDTKSGDPLYVKKLYAGK